MKETSNALLCIVAVLLAMNLLRSTPVRAASSRVVIQQIENKGTVEVTGDVVGFSCVNKGAYTQCSIASR
jgi:hypothetical protein